MKMRQKAEGTVLAYMAGLQVETAVDIIVRDIRQRRR